MGSRDRPIDAEITIIFNVSLRSQSNEPPMKRHASFVPLSRDHHDGLVLAQRLILGRSTNPRADWPTERAEQVGRLLAFFETALRKHIEAEEAHVFPVAMEAGNAHEVARQLIDEHDDMRARIRAFEEDPTTRLAERLTAFGELLKGHIHKEERVLFERMQAELDADALRAIGVRLDEYASAAAGSACRM